MNAAGSLLLRPLAHADVLQLMLRRCSALQSVAHSCCAYCSQVVPFSQPHKHGRPHKHSLEEEMDAHIGYWGVVVQSQMASEAQGCYVLKTVHSASPSDCQCTHFTLTRVSRGEPLADQLASAWLA